MPRALGHPLRLRLDVEQVDVLGERGRRHLLERRDVDDVGAPPVGRHDQVVLARMDDQVRDLDRRHARLERQPALPAVERDVDAPLRPDEEQVGVLPVLDDHVDGLAGRQVAGDRRPGLAVVGRLVDGRPVIVQAPARLGSRKPCPRRAATGRRGSPRNSPARPPRRASPSGRARSPRRPSSPGPCRRPPRPDDPGLDRRFGQRRQRAVGDVALAVLFRVLVGRQVRADLLPVLAAVEGAEDDLGARCRRWPGCAATGRWAASS